MVDRIAQNNDALNALNAYNKVNSRSFGEGIDVNLDNSVNFHQMFNSYAKMSPNEILAHIHNTKNINSKPSGGFIVDTISSVGAIVRDTGIVTQSALLGGASKLELATSAAKAKTTVRAIVAFRDNFVQQWDKIFNIQL